MALVVDNPGLLTTVQDEGRFGYARFGMSPSGPMDRVAFETANILVGNDPGESALEMTMLGPTLTLLGEGVLAVTGADMASRINGRPCPRYQAVAYHDGDRLEMGFAASGARAYLAVSGGFDVPKVMGSRSTAVQNQVGGFEGRKLKAGDRLALGTPKYLPADPDPRHAEPPTPSPRRGWTPSMGRSIPWGPIPTAWAIGWKAPSLRWPGTETSSPTASYPAVSRYPALGCPSSCCRNVRPWAAIPRSPRSSPPICPCWASANRGIGSFFSP